MRVEGTMKDIRAVLLDLQAFLEPVVPHLGAIENELLEVQAILSRIERRVGRGKRARV